MIGVNKASANTISNKLHIFPKEDEHCNSVRVCCIVNRCGAKTLMAVWLGGRRESMLTVVASEQEARKRSNLKGRTVCSMFQYYNPKQKIFLLK